jgi:hypothetical protein
MAAIAMLSYLTAFRDGRSCHAETCTCRVYRSPALSRISASPTGNWDTEAMVLRAAVRPWPRQTKMTMALGERVYAKNPTSALGP